MLLAPGDELGILHRHPGDQLGELGRRNGPMRQADLAQHQLRRVEVGREAPGALLLLDRFDPAGVERLAGAPR